MSTDVHTRRRRLRDGIAKQGACIDGLWAYPLFHSVYGNADFVVVHSVSVDDGVLQVVGDPDNGWTEWVWFRGPEPHSDTTAEVRFSRAGFGSVGYALHDGLDHAFGRIRIQ